MPSTFAGFIVAGPGRIDPVGVSSNIDTLGAFSTARKISAGGFILSGAVTIGGSGAANVTLDGALDLLFGGLLFERIIVIPRLEDLKFILTDKRFPIEVWNTYHDDSQTLTAIALGGVGGIVLTNPYTLPKVIGPKDSLIFQAVMPSAGPSSINQSVVFTITGIPTGTDAVLTGTRILVFTVQPDWEAGVRETISYMTDIFTSRNNSERRRGLRRIARRGLSFMAKTLEARDAAGLEALLWGWQHLPYGVPFWPDAMPLDADTPAGSSTLPVTTVDRLFAPGSVVLLWRDEFTFEALTIGAVGPSSIGVTSPTVLDWKKGFATFVVPVFQGRLAAALDVDRLWSGADSVQVAFEGEAGQIAFEPVVTLAQFKGFDVLEVAPDWSDDLHRRYTRSTTILDSGVGLITVADKGGTAIVSHDLPWFIETHAEVTALRGFLFRRFGQLKPFWCPTFDQDLVLALDALAAQNQVTIEAVNYTRFFFPTRARQFLALFPTDGTAKQYVEVAAATDNGNGTETLTLTAPLATTLTVGKVMISFLTFSRQQEDDTEINWLGREVAEATVRIQELPQEVPA